MYMYVCMYVCIVKTEVMVSGVKGGVSVTKVDLFGMCGKRVRANSVMPLKMRNGFIEDV